MPGIPKATMLVNSLTLNTTWKQVSNQGSFATYLNQDASYVDFYPTDGGATCKATFGWDYSSIPSDATQMNSLQMMIKFRPYSATNLQTITFKVMKGSTQIAQYQWVNGNSSSSQTQTIPIPATASVSEIKQWTLVLEASKIASATSGDVELYHIIFLGLHNGTPPPVPEDDPNVYWIKPKAIENSTTNPCASIVDGSVGSVDNIKRKHDDEGDGSYVFFGNNTASTGGAGKLQEAFITFDYSEVPAAKAVEQIHFSMRYRLRGSWISYLRAQWYCDTTPVSREFALDKSTSSSDGVVVIKKGAINMTWNIANFKKLKLKISVKQQNHAYNMAVGLYVFGMTYYAYQTGAKCDDCLPVPDKTVYTVDSFEATKLYTYPSSTGTEAHYKKDPFGTNTNTNSFGSPDKAANLGTVYFDCNIADIFDRGTTIEKMEFGIKMKFSYQDCFEYCKFQITTNSNYMYDDDTASGYVANDDYGATILAEMDVPFSSSLKLYTLELPIRTYTNPEIQNMRLALKLKSSQDDYYTIGVAGVGVRVNNLVPLMYWGSQQVNAIYLGSTNVTDIFLGSTQL